MHARACLLGAVVTRQPVVITTRDALTRSDHLIAPARESVTLALINGAQYNTFQPAYLWATIITAAVLGLLFYTVVALIERRVVTWRVGE